MEKLEKKVTRFLNGPMQAHVLAGIQRMRFETAERFDRLEQRLDVLLTTLLMTIILPGEEYLENFGGNQGIDAAA
ncbi:hypothetical protein SLEP1_g50972 [Rubroshorea leprosula]|uniref:Uncharacterized protein n=1 Tax=Rubroshorea leprosula TaxID=152421 RepID=A0AAV5M1Q3_9ROSI|nr:hypothetical protein SLEP1_g50972 [Rubroshorea leprosula]